LDELRRDSLSDLREEPIATCKFANLRGLGAASNFSSTAELLCDSFAIPRPSIGELMKHIVVRHDIVHRGGKTRDGNGVIVTTETLTQLRADVVAFIEELEAHLKKTFPEPGSAGLGQIDDF